MYATAIGHVIIYNLHMMNKFLAQNHGKTRPFLLQNVRECTATSPHYGGFLPPHLLYSISVSLCSHSEIYMPIMLTTAFNPWLIVLQKWWSSTSPRTPLATYTVIIIYIYTKALKQQWDQLKRTGTARNGLSEGILGSRSERGPRVKFVLCDICWLRSLCPFF